MATADRITFLRRRRGYYYRQFNFISKQLDEYDQSGRQAESQLLYLEKHLDKYGHEFNAIQLELAEFSEEDDERGIGMSEQYYSLGRRIQQLVTDARQTSPSTPTTVSNTPLIESVDLPKFQLPTFSGAYEDWPGFADQFRSTVHENPRIDDGKRLLYLRSCLTHDAALVISSLSNTANNYSIAWEILEQRYNRPGKIVERHVQEIINAAFSSPTTHRELQSYTIKLESHYKALESLGQLSVDAVLLYLCTFKLNRDIDLRWKDKMQSTPFPTFKEFLKFLNNQCQILEPARPTRETRRHALVTSQPRALCPICHGLHKIWRCNTFRTKTIKERLTAIEEISACTNCLMIAHTLPHCNAGACRICKQRHHTLLHRFDARIKDRNISEPKQFRMWSYRPHLTNTTFINKAPSSRSMTIKSPTVATANAKEVTPLLREPSNSNDQFQSVSSLPDGYEQPGQRNKNLVMSHRKQVTAIKPFPTGIPKTMANSHPPKYSSNTSTHFQGRKNNCNNNSNNDHTRPTRNIASNRSPIPSHDTRISLHNTRGSLHDIRISSPICVLTTTKLEFSLSQRSTSTLSNASNQKTFHTRNSSLDTNDASSTRNSTINPHDPLDRDELNSAHDNNGHPPPTENFASNLTSIPPHDPRISLHDTRGSLHNTRSSSPKRDLTTTTFASLTSQQPNSTPPTALNQTVFNTRSSSPTRDLRTTSHDPLDQKKEETSPGDKPSHTVISPNPSQDVRCPVIHSEKSNGFNPINYTEDNLQSNPATEAQESTMTPDINMLSKTYTSWTQLFHDTSWIVNFYGKFLGNAENHGNPDYKAYNVSSTKRPFGRIIELTLAMTALFIQLQLILSL